MLKSFKAKVMNLEINNSDLNTATSHIKSIYINWLLVAKLPADSMIYLGFTIKVIHS